MESQGVNTVDIKIQLVNTTHDEVLIKGLSLESTDILKLKLTLVKDSWPKKD